MRLKILHLNVRHWNNPANINIFSNYFLQENLDIITIKSHSITRADKNVKLANYSGYTKNKEIHAGVAILIKKEIPHSFHMNTSNKNFMTVTLKTNQGDLTIITFYKPPRQKNLPLMDINNILQINNPTLILADANLKHQYFGHNTNDQNGNLLKDFMTHSNLHFLGPYFDTFHEGNKKGKPDLIIGNTNILTMAYHSTEGKKLPVTEHIPIILELSHSPILVKDTPKYNYNRAN